MCEERFGDLSVLERLSNINLHPITYSDACFFSHHHPLMFVKAKSIDR